MQRNQMIAIFCSVIIAAMVASALTGTGPSPGVTINLAALTR